MSMALSIRHSELQVLSVFTPLSVFWLTFWKTPLLLRQAGRILFTCSSVKMLKEIDVCFLSLLTCFPEGKFCVHGIVDLCFTWKYCLCPHDLWWLFSCSLLSWNHLLYCRIEEKNQRNRLCCRLEGKNQRKTHALKMWGLGWTCCSY